MATASYDGDGMRASAASTPSGGGSTTEHFVWDETGSTPQLLMDSTNAYLYGPGSTPIEQVNLSTGTVKYLVSDALGSVRGIVNSSGSLGDSTTYDAWGNPETTGGLTSDTPIGFAGSYTDPTGLLYLINRYYDPATGQFLNVDPLVDATGAPYFYTGDDPVNGTDPTGMCGQLGPGEVGPFIPCDQYLSGVSASNEQLKNLINQLYRPGAKVGDGGTGDMLREESKNPDWDGNLSDLGHWTKVNDRINELSRLLRRGNLCEEDRPIAENLLEDLENAKATAELASDAVSLGLPPDATPGEIENVSVDSEEIAGDLGEANGALGEAEGFFGDLGEFG
jgi:RHS repeat-associated protein